MTLCVGFIDVLAVGFGKWKMKKQMGSGRADQSVFY